MISPSDWQLKSTGWLGAVLEAAKGNFLAHDE